MNALDVIREAVEWPARSVSAQDAATYATLGWIESIARDTARDGTHARRKLAEIVEALDARDQVLAKYRR